MTKKKRVNKRTTTRRKKIKNLKFLAINNYQKTETICFA